MYIHHLITADFLSRYPLPLTSDLFYGYKISDDFVTYLYNYTETREKKIRND